MAHQLLERTEGWILGLKILLFSMDEYTENIPDIHQSENLSIFSEFMEQHSLKQFSDGFKQVLLYASLLDRFNAVLIDYTINH
jgi:ATP/maltotriose-dependent transcriptional regulator MalT